MLARDADVAQLQPIIPFFEDDLTEDDIDPLDEDMEKSLDDWIRYQDPTPWQWVARTAAADAKLESDDVGDHESREEDENVNGCKAVGNDENVSYPGMNRCRLQ